MRLDELTEPSLILPGVAGVDRATVLRAIASVIGTHSGLQPDELHERLEQREALGSTAIGHGVAIPHCKMPKLDKVLMAVAISRRAIDYEASDGNPVRLFFVVISPERRPADHLKCLAAIARWVQDADHVEKILALRDPVAIHARLGPDPLPATPPDTAGSA